MNADKITRLHDFNEITDLVEGGMKELVTKFDAHKEKVLAELTFTESCKGCTLAGCCYQQVSCTIVEALPIARRLRREGKSTAEFRAHLRKVGEEMESMNRDAWFNRSQPCVFLTPENKCSVYEQRPTPCACYSSVSPREHCSPPLVKLRKIGTLDMSGIQEQMLFMQEAFQHSFGLPTRGVTLMGSMPKMVAIVLEAMTQPWDKFIDYLWEHGKLDQETLDRVLTDMKPFELVKEYFTKDML